MGAEELGRMIVSTLGVLVVGVFVAAFVAAIRDRVTLADFHPDARNKPRGR
jgi:hypothetical protein